MTLVLNPLPQAEFILSSTQETRLLFGVFAALLYESISNQDIKSVCIDEEVLTS